MFGSRESLKTRKRQEALTLVSLFLLSEATPEPNGAVWNHDVHRWQVMSDSRRRHFVATPSMLVILNGFVRKGHVAAAYEPTLSIVESNENSPNVPRKFYRPTPPGELAALYAIPILREANIVPSWLPEATLQTPQLPEGFEFTMPIRPLRDFTRE